MDCATEFGLGLGVAVPTTAKMRAQGRRLPAFRPAVRRVLLAGCRHKSTVSPRCRCSTFASDTTVHHEGARCARTGLSGVSRDPRVLLPGRWCAEGQAGRYPLRAGPGHPVGHPARSPVRRPPSRRRRRWRLRTGGVADRLEPVPQPDQESPRQLLRRGGLRGREVRYQRDRPGELVSVDTKEIGRLVGSLAASNGAAVLGKLAATTYRSAKRRSGTTS